MLDIYHTVLPLMCQGLQLAAESVPPTHGLVLISVQTAVVDETTVTAG